MYKKAITAIIIILSMAQPVYALSPPTQEYSQNCIVCGAPLNGSHTGSNVKIPSIGPGGENIPDVGPLRQIFATVYDLFNVKMDIYGFEISYWSVFIWILLATLFIWMVRTMAEK